MKKKKSILLLLAAILLFPNMVFSREIDTIPFEGINLVDIGGDHSYNEKYELDNGYVYGISDYFFEGNDLYILNSANSSIYLVKEGISNKLFTLKDMEVRLFDKQNNCFTIWGYIDGKSALKVINKEGEEINYFIPIEVSEALVALKTLGEKTYISISQDGQILTYELFLNNGKVQIVGNTRGELVEKGLYYSEEKVKNNSFSRKLIFEENGEKKEIIIERDLPIVTTQLLGKVDDRYVLKVLEDISFFREDEVLTSIILLDRYGKIVSERVMEDSSENIEKFKPVTVYNGELKSIDEKVNVVNTPKEELLFEKSKGEVPFKEVMESHTLGVKGKNYVSKNIDSSNIIPLGSISGDRIINNAKKYHTEFGYYFASYNTTSDSNWRKPAQLSTVDAWYNMMPYCFGGYDTPSECINKLNNAYLAGHAAGYVYNGSKRATGIDCSGLVCKAWELPVRYSTSSLAQAGNPVSPYNLQKGDIMNNAGKHVMIVESVDNGVVTAYEATYNSSWGRVAHTTHYLSTLINNGYKAYRVK